MALQTHREKERKGETKARARPTDKNVYCLIVKALYESRRLRYSNEAVTHIGAPWRERKKSETSGGHKHHFSHCSTGYWVLVVCCAEAGMLVPRTYLAGPGAHRMFTFVSLLTGGFTSSRWHGVYLFVWLLWVWNTRLNCAQLTSDWMIQLFPACETRVCLYVRLPRQNLYATSRVFRDTCVVSEE